MMKSKFLNVLALILVIVGALNWGLWGFFQFDLVAWIAKGNTTPLARLIYSIVGLSGLLAIRFLIKCKHTHSCCCSHDEDKKMQGPGGGGCCK